MPKHQPQIVETTDHHRIKVKEFQVEYGNGMHNRLFELQTLFFGVLEQYKREFVDASHDHHMEIVKHSGEEHMRDEDY